MAKSEDLSKLREEYIKKSVLTNRIFMLMLGLSILLLLFIILPYYLSLEHLNILKDEKDQFQNDFTRFSSFNNSLVNYYQNYEKIAEPLIDNDFKNISSRINELVLSGLSIYPECDKIIITGDFFKCNIRLMAENEYDYLINNQSKSILSSTFKSVLSNWDINYAPKITLIRQNLLDNYNSIINNSNTIQSTLLISQQLNGVTKTFFEKDVPRETISIFLGNPGNQSIDSLESNQASLKDLLLSFKSNITKIEGDITNTEGLIASIIKRIGDVGTPIGSIALGFEEILVFSPIILAFFYLIFLSVLKDTIRLKKEHIPPGDIVDTINPLLFFSSQSKFLRLILLISPFFVFIVYSALMLSLWARFDPFFIFDAYFWVFAILYTVSGVILIVNIFRVQKEVV
ncbi:hypothetical protein NMY3_03191 [Candidatus Nitrosocosmicus oleophilus]|uniref:Uncharacterized protein n=1 Tax=Candidatus Nitrosocosmicus oleophilus TaxID=1353260 RepID=A0A654M3Z9_9ARCH|nr:hypothetical protein [Candidatus Nitrosocosmicus oleophilus]ALI37376.1 hypothetical protein NMY3_03191 [Candidatus Nitrosocosmicus oleophilus]